jgi:hypothetical protein
MNFIERFALKQIGNGLCAASRNIGKRDPFRQDAVGKKLFGKRSDRDAIP